jgi:cell division septum initiation protein DivIVA
MLHTYYKHVERGTIRQYEAEEFNKSYAGYKALDGNSFIDDVAKKVKDWEITT